MKEKYIKTARGLIEADLVLKNAHIINVFTEEIITGDVAIINDTIVGIGDYNGQVEINCTNKYLVPGYIDAHMHIESSMVTPLELSKKIITKGTTTIIADPHEIVNVAGKDGLDYILEATDNLPIDAYIMIPSSVPATDVDINGAGNFDVEDIKPYLNHPRVLGLGEVMRYNDVINSKKNILDKINLFSNHHTIDGHSPRINGKEVQAYRVAGINNDHECESALEALEKLRAGFNIFIREGSATKNLDTLLSGLLQAKVDLSNCSFCSDDKHLEDISHDGHISHNIKKALDINTPTIKAYKMASYNTAKAFNIKNLGAISAGYQADIIILDSLDDPTPNQVIKSGKIVDENLLNSYSEVTIKNELLNTVSFNDVSLENLFVRRYEKNHLIELVPYSILTKHCYETIPGENETFIANEVFSKLCVVERYQKTNNIACASLKGFNIKNGAIATSVSHDSHNVIAVGDNDQDLVIAINEIKKLQGGYVIVSNNKVLSSLPLKLGGLMSLESADYVENQVKIMIEQARKLNVPIEVDPFTTLSFISLSVIPEIRLLEAGLYNVVENSFIKDNE